MLNILKIIEANVNKISIQEAKELVGETRTLIRLYDDYLEETGQNLKGEIPEGYPDYDAEIRYGVTVLSMLVGKAYDFE